MILNSAPQDQAVMSNVGQIGEFRIRNSAKAFNILSSGLYANKIKAIIRELSCNAVDSHVAADKSHVPFDVHLPNAIEPHFSIRDYGTGLTHDRVTNIYTTYFESTKTDSNAFIGALGLGSKSPFSYTDNFTVTAVKDGRKGVYTAFINEQGVPSIALMMEEETTDPSGVEVKFSVNDRYDFDKFKQEAREVYKYFKLQPVVSGAAGFEIPKLNYNDMNIIPGVHATDERHRSVAIMGNIAYPFDVPNAQTNLGDLYHLLACGLVMEFDIGELDFQASREGLSYIPSTIEAIKRKLEQLNAQLAVHVATEANAITNLWERNFALAKRYNMNLWRVAVVKYVTDTKFELFDPHSYQRAKTFKLNVKDLAEQYNIAINGFTRLHSTTSVCKSSKPSSHAVNGTYVEYWPITVSSDLKFIITDTKVGAGGRAKYHYRSKNLSGSVLVLHKADKTKEMNLKAFFNAISNPPEKQVMLASDLDQPEKLSSMGRNVTIMKLEKREVGGWRRSSVKMVWADAGKADSFDSKTTFYYVPLSGYQSLGKVEDVKALYDHLHASSIYTGEVYGVRKTDMEWVKLQKNWVQLDAHVADKLANLGQADVMGLVKQAVDFDSYFNYNVFNALNPNSPYKKLHDTFKDVKAANDTGKRSIEFLCSVYGVTTKQKVDPTALIAKYRDELKDLKKRYPLLESINRYGAEKAAVAEYINLVDEKKGV